VQRNQQVPEGSSATPRYVGVLLLLMLIGLPLLVVSGLFVKAGPARVVDGPQPGGVLAGRVVDAEGRPIVGVNLMLWLAEPADDGGFSASTAPKAAPLMSDEQGRFALTAPAHTGHYQVVAEGDLWVGARKSITLIDSDGGAHDPGEIELVLEPACLLRLELVDSDGERVGRGEFELRGNLEGGPLFGLLGGKQSIRGTILDGMLERGGLPTMEATISIEMDDGKTAEITLPLAPGIVRDRIEL